MFNRRKFTRKKCTGKVIAQVVQCFGKALEQPVTICCECVDASEKGLQMHSASEVPIGSILRLKIAVQNPKAVFALDGLVQWMRFDEFDGRWTHGLLLSSPTESNMATWASLVGQLERLDSTDENGASLEKDSGSVW